MGRAGWQYLCLICTPRVQTQRAKCTRITRKYRIANTVVSPTDQDGREVVTAKANRVANKPKKKNRWTRLACLMSFLMVLVVMSALNIQQRSTLRHWAPRVQSSRVARCSSLLGTRWELTMAKTIHRMVNRKLEAVQLRARLFCGLLIPGRTADTRVAQSRQS